MCVYNIFLEILASVTKQDKEMAHKNGKGSSKTVIICRTCDYLLGKNLFVKAKRKAVKIT